MDSLTQFVLGAAVGVAVMGRRTAVWKAALWGGVCGTLPDLDAFIDHGDPVSNMTLHRGNSHALFWLSVLTPPIGALIAKVQGEWPLWRRWCVAVWLALVTHPLLDFMTVYGTQLARPFTDQPYGLGSIFIIDLLYTVPLMVGVGLALRRRDTSGLRWNQLGLLLSTAYLAWSAAAQQYVTTLARSSLEAQGINATQLLVTPAPLNTVLWRVVAMTPDSYHEGFYSLFDAQPQIHFDRHDRGAALEREMTALPPVQRLSWFTHGFYRLSDNQGSLSITDLRMGQEPAYTFSFVVAERRGDQIVSVRPAAAGQRPDIPRALAWLWRRAKGEDIPPPR